MDIAVARTFLEIVKAGSFVNAGANLNLTQTAISARIRVLEDQLERPLFIRSRAGAKLTPAGEQFLRFATTLVQTWDRARRAVALPEGKATVVALGAELSLWSPLIRHWLLWVRRECPEFAIDAQIAGPEELINRVQDGSLDVAVLYAAPRAPGIVAELLFEEKLVMVRTTFGHEQLEQQEQVRISWGDEFAERYRAAFPDVPSPVVSISHGPLALEYILAAGGSGYFRQGFIRAFLESGQLELVPDRPQFSYSAYAVHSTKADEETSARLRAGLRQSVREMA